MTKKRKIYTGKLPQVPTKQIYLNIKDLETGTYTLKIIDESRIVKQTTFKK